VSIAARAVRENRNIAAVPAIWVTIAALCLFSCPLGEALPAPALPGKRPTRAFSFSSSTRHLLVPAV
jgi:hypothetical protein